MRKGKIRSEFGFLLVGDLAVFVASLWLTLAIRNLAWPSSESFTTHLAPFSLLFVVWILFFFIAGLYDKNTLFIKSILPGRIFQAHIFNLIVAGIFFYAIPYFGVAPKLTLFLYLLVSSLIIAFWRLFIYNTIAERTAIPVVLLADPNTKEIIQLNDFLKKSGNAYINIVRIIDPKSLNQDNALLEINKILEEECSDLVAIDTVNEDVRGLYASLYKFVFSKTKFIDVQDLYENVTDMVPLGLIDEKWFLEHATFEPNFIYNSIKRIMDIVIALPLAIVSLIFYPFVWILIKLDDGGPIFIYQDRVGENEKLVHIIKFRSMRVFSEQKASDDGVWVQKQDMRITRVGSFLRKSRIDELPQLWNIIRGDLSLIGPRPELPKLVDLYKKEIPHYNVRHLIKPGLSGWAQIHHEKPPHSIEETVEKLSYDLYYIKHRSFWLDIKIALQTIKTLLSRVGV